MNSLNQTVEHIVSSIHASEKRKNKMREELLAHITAIYHEELAKGTEKQTAFEQTLQRFGNTKLIQRDLQSTVPFWERIPEDKKRGFVWMFIYFISALIYLLMNDEYYLKNNPFRYHDSNRIILFWVLFIILYLGGFLSYFSRKLSSRPTYNLCLQLSSLAALDVFLWKVLRPLTLSTIIILIKRGYPVAWFWFDSFILINTVFLLLIWKDWKRKTRSFEMLQPN